MKRYISKLVLCGEMAVGKTSIRRKYFGERFLKEHLATLGADFNIKRLTLDENNTLELQIWDIAGQTNFQGLRKRFFRGATCAFMIFDLTRKDTFYKLEKWINEVWDVNKSKEMPIAIIGNKMDLETPEVKMEDVLQFLNKIRSENDLSDSTFLKYYETSAMTGENINICFEEMAKAVIEFNKKFTEVI